MNPQDLLYTNRFDAKHHFERERDTRTRDRLNILKSIDQPFPRRFNRNHEPILSEEVRDLVKDRYKKKKIRSICIDSRDRDLTFYPQPNNYKVDIASEFNNIEAIQLTSLDLGSLFLTQNQISWTINDTNYIANIPNGVYSTQELAIAMINQMGQFPNQDNNNIAQNVVVSINSITHQVKLFNRLEGPQIIAIQTILRPEDDIFRCFVAPQSFNKNAIYVLVKHNVLLNDITRPLIPNNIPNIGGIPNTLINCQQFWKTPPSNDVGTYTCYDTVTINGVQYQRYELIPNPPICASFAQNIITSNALKSILNQDVANFKDVFQCDGDLSVPQIGRAEQWAINFTTSPLMSIFGWNETGQNFGFVLTNQSSANTMASCLNIDRDCCGNYFFRIEPYIFLKIQAPSFPEDKIANNIVKTQDNNLLRTLVCQPDPRIQRDTHNLFAKIALSNPIKILSSVLQFYQTPLEELRELQVLFVDRNGCPLDLQCDHFFTLEIVEVIDVLKDTLIDSRHGETIETGIYYRQQPETRNVKQ